MRLVVETTPITLLILLGAFVSSSSSIKVRDSPLAGTYAPAPPPDQGPPLSAGALRDPAYLPVEVGGIVGAYFIAVVFIIVALLSVGRRLRIETAVSQQVLDVEMQQPPNTYPSPISPQSVQKQPNFSWPSPEKNDKNPYIFPSANQSPRSPGSNPSVDFRVVEADRENLNRGLEHIYAHVMAHEDAKLAARTASQASLSQPPLSPRGQPPHASLPAPEPIPATQPQRLHRRDEKMRPAKINLDQAAPAKTQSRAASIISSLKSPRKKNGPRTIHISSPIPTPLSPNYKRGYASDEEPLSPVHYTPPPPPPVPKDQEPYTHSRNNSSNASVDPSPISPTRSIADTLAMPYAAQHNYQPSQSSFQSGATAVNPLASYPLGPEPTKKTLPPINTGRNTPKTITPTPTQPPSHNNSTRTLPFRAFDPPPGISSPSFSHSTKTTVLERTGPSVRSPGLKTPWTAGAVPYSPYQPHTPLTPFSPRLVTKQDRKLQKKMEGRTPVLEMIKSEDELWDSAY